MTDRTVRQYATVENGFIHVQLPKDFDAKRVELLIIPLSDEPSPLSDFQQFLLDSPEMSDEEFYAIQDKRAHLNQWK